MAKNTSIIWIGLPVFAILGGICHAQVLKGSRTGPVAQTFRWNLNPTQVQELSHNVSAGTVVAFPVPSGPSQAMIAAAQQRRGLHMALPQAATTNGRGPLLSPTPVTLLPASPAPTTGSLQTQAAIGSSISPGMAQPVHTVSSNSSSMTGRLGVVPRPMPCMKPAVADVGGFNGSTSWTYVEPGKHYVIHGCGFGNQPGEVYLIGVKRAPATSLSRVSTPQYLGVHSHPGWIRLIPSPGADPKEAQIWMDTEIQVIVDPNVSGFYDDFPGDATVVVLPAGGKPQIQSAAGFGFWAARVEQLLPSAPVSAAAPAIRKQSNPAVNLNQSNPVVVANTQSWFTPAHLMDAKGAPLQANLLSPSAASLVLPGHTFAVVRDDNGAQFSGSQDVLDLAPSLLQLSYGFQVSRVQLFTASLSSASCNGSNFSTNGNWNTIWPNKYNYDQIDVSWQEQSCGQGGVSAYAMDVFVSGPRGINPQF